MYLAEKDKGKGIKKVERTFQTVFLLFSCAVSTLLTTKLQKITPKPL